MGGLLVIAAGALGIYALSRRPSSGGTTTSILPVIPSIGGGDGSGLTFAPYGPQSDPRNWYQGIKPGTVSIGGQQTHHFDGAGNMKIAQTAAGLTATGISAAESIAVATTHAGLLSGTLAGSVIPVAGIAIALVGTVLSIISAHHQAAVAAEGKALNDADARMLDALVLVLQAVLAGEITTASQAQSHLSQIVADWYAEVKNVQKGTWHYTGQDMRAGFNTTGSKPSKGQPGYSDYHAPDPCNGPCVVGHFFTERGALLVIAAVKDAMAGNHGALVLPAVQPHDTQAGVPEIQAVY